MYTLLKLNNKNMSIFKKLNDKRTDFNPINIDFFNAYNNMNFFKQVLIKKRVYLLKSENDCPGYIWINNEDRYMTTINSMYVKNTEFILDAYKYLIDSVINSNIIVYNCSKNDYNFDLLTSLGFEKADGTILMNYNVTKPFELKDYKGISFTQLIKGKQEKTRTEIQNEVFQAEGRIPLTEEDVYFDELQRYYWDKGAILVKSNLTKEYIGYGQIILENEIPYIVNIGIRKNYRNNGFAELLMKYIINILYKYGYKEVFLKVSLKNSIALNLYKHIGFEIKTEYFKWQLKR